MDEDRSRSDSHGPGVLIPPPLLFAFPLLKRLGQAGGSTQAARTSKGRRYGRIRPIAAKDAAMSRMDAQRTKPNRRVIGGVTIAASADPTATPRTTRLLVTG